jgi:hypothetical protein
MAEEKKWDAIYWKGAQDHAKKSRLMVEKLKGKEGEVDNDISEEIKARISRAWDTDLDKDLAQEAKRIEKQEIAPLDTLETQEDIGEEGKAILDAMQRQVETLKAEKEKLKTQVINIETV